MPEHRRNFGYWMGEFVLIILGVLLALVVNEWRENRASQSRAQLALQHVLQEIKSNQTVLSRIHENNQKAIHLITSESENAPGDSSGQPGVQFTPGLQLKSTAWSTMTTTGLSNYLDWQTVMKLADLYAVQDVYQQSGRWLVSSALNASAFAAASNRKISDKVFDEEFRDFILMVWKIEEELLKKYQETLVMPDFKK